MTNYYNPDAPVSGNFVSNTYQSFNQPQESFYYNGANPFQEQNADSRRNIGMPTMQQAFTQVQPSFGQPMNNALAESQLQPFSSYPPATPQQAPVARPMFNAGGLNAQLNSRRNDTCNPAVANPFQTQPVMMNAAQPQMPVVNPYMAMYANPGVEPAVQALYVNQPVNPFDRKTAWENQYTQCRQIDQPYVNWNMYAPSVQQPLNPSAAYQAQMAQPQYPTMNAPAYPAADKSWLEIAKANWGV